MKVTIFSPPGMQGEIIRRDTQLALDGIGVKASVEVRTSEFDCAQAGVMCTPAMSIDGRLVSNGWVPDSEELAELIKVSV